MSRCARAMLSANLAMIARNIRHTRYFSTKNLMFLGAPGVGKGTFATRIAPVLGIPTLSTGDIIRTEIKNGSSLAAALKDYTDKGLLVPDEIVFAMVKKRLSEPDAKDGFLLDGFPRTVNQAEMLEAFRKMDAVINITLREDVLVQKLSGRRVCSACGDNYNIANIKLEEIDMPPLLPKQEGCCDKCGGKLVQRNDDKEDVIRKRLDVYLEETHPLIEYYSKKGILSDFNVKRGIKDLPDLQALINKIFKMA